MTNDSIRIANYDLHTLMSMIIYGVATGDALGFPMQFKSRAQAQTEPIIDMGKYRDRAGNIQSYSPSVIGLWSDDTSLTLCLADSLVLGYSLKDMAHRNYAWLTEGYLSALDYAFDIGRQCNLGIRQALAIALENPEQLSTLIEQNIESANGNGALMRMLPLIIATYGEDIDTAFTYVKEVSALTHPHLRSAFVCLYYLRFAERILNKMDKKSAFIETQAEMRDFAPKAGLSQRDLSELKRLLHDDISRLESDPNAKGREDYLCSSGYAVHSLEAALWCILKHETYEETLLAAVALGEDTDSIAAIAGGVVTFLYGLDAIPAPWIDALQNTDEMERVLDLYLMF